MNVTPVQFFSKNSPKAPPGCAPPSAFSFYLRCPHWLIQFQASRWSKHLTALKAHSISGSIHSSRRILLRRNPARSQMDHARRELNKAQPGLNRSLVSQLLLKDNNSESISKRVRSKARSATAVRFPSSPAEVFRSGHSCFLARCHSPSYTIATIVTNRAIHQRQRQLPRRLRDRRRLQLPRESPSQVRCSCLDPGWPRQAQV